MAVGSFVIDTMTIEVEVPVLAPCERVFHALTEKVAHWWGSPYLHRDDAKGLYLDASIGGDFWEEWPEGGGALWGRVVCMQPAALLAIEGPMGMPGPVNSMVRITIKSNSEHDDPAASSNESSTVNSCVVRVTHRAFGRLTVEMKEEYAIGWDDLLRLRLKPYVEHGVEHGLGHPVPRETELRMRELS